MAFSELKGSDLIQMMLDRLGGYANAFTADTLLDFLNEGKDSVWSVLKSLNENFFQRSSQYADNSKDNYFAAFTPSSREYQLPVDFRAIRFIECVTNGFTSARFTKRRMTDDDFKAARRAANDPINSTLGTAQFEYLYDIVESDNGGFEMVLAQYPSTTLQLVIWYIRGLSDFESDSTISQIIRPFSKKIVNYAVERALLTLQDESLSQQWLERFRADVIGIAQSAGPVNAADPVFVSDFEG